MRMLVFVGLWFALVGPVRADDGSREKSRRLSQAAAVLARQGQFEQAAELFQQAYDLDPDPILLYNRGIMLEKLGDLPGARDQLTRYLDQEQDEGLREKGRLRLVAIRARIGTLRVEVDVPGAAIAVDGTLRGESPLAPLELAEGEHRVTVSHAGYHAAEQAVRVAARHETLVALRLVALAGRVRVGTDVAGALVLVDGVPRGQTPLSDAIDVEPGVHVVRLEAEGRQPFETTVEVGAAKEVPVLALLAPLAEPESAPELVPAVAPRSVEPFSDTAAAGATTGGEGAAGEGAGPGVAEVAGSGPLTVWGGVGIGLGLALAGTGGVFTWLAAKDRGEVNDAEQRNGVVVGLTQVQAQALQRRANDRNQTAWVFYGVGGGVVLTGIVLQIVDALRGSDERVSWGPMLVPGGAGAGVTGRF